MSSNDIVISIVCSILFLLVGLLMLLYSHRFFYWWTKTSIKLGKKFFKDLFSYFNLNEESIMQLYEKSWATKIVIWSWRIFGVIFILFSILNILLIVFSTN